MAATILHLRQTESIWGPDRHIIQLTRALPGAGYAVDVAVLDPSWRKARASLNPLVQAAVAMQARSEALPARWHNLAGLVARLLKWIDARSIQLIHSHEFKTQVIGDWLSRWSGVPHVTSDHGELTSLARWYRVGLWRARHCIQVVAGSADRVEALRQRGFPATQIAHCPYGIDLEEIENSSTAERAVVRARFGVGENHFVVLCPARMEPQKGQDVLVAALGRIVARHERVRLWLTGSTGTAWEASLRKQVVTSGLDRHVAYLGHYPVMADLLRASDLVVLPSRQENFPYAVLEAFALARPVIATRVGGVPELVQDSVNGWLVPPAAPESLAEAISVVILDPKSAAKRAAAGRITVDRSFTARAMAETMVAIYRGILGAEAPNEI
jgi:glycosyltransferase involved in cell wall biosynthesis